MSKHRFFLASCLAVALLACGTEKMQALDLFGGGRKGNASIVPDHQRGEASRSRLLQQEMMDYSDRFTMAVWEALDRYLREETDPQKRSAAEHWKVLYSAASMQIAAGRDPAGSLLDMAVLADLAEWSVARSWNPKVFGKGGEPLLEALREKKKEIGSILAGVLTPSQRVQLDVIITNWKRRHPDALYVAGIRLADLSGAKASKEEKTGGLILVADVSRALGKADEALQYGERAMFYVERLPRLTTMQTSLALAQMGSTPAMLSLTASAEKASSAITELPDRITSAIGTNAATVKEILPGFRETVTESRKLAEAVDRTVNSTAFTDTNKAPSPWTPEVTVQAIDHLGSTLHEGNELARSLSGGGSLLDALFYRALILLLVLIMGVGGLIILHRKLSGK